MISERTGWFMFGMGVLLAGPLGVFYGRHEEPLVGFVDHGEIVDNPPEARLRAIERDLKASKDELEDLRHEAERLQHEADHLHDLIDIHTFGPPAPGPRR